MGLNQIFNFGKLLLLGGGALIFVKLKRVPWRSIIKSKYLCTIPFASTLLIFQSNVKQNFFPKKIHSMAMSFKYAKILYQTEIEQSNYDLIK